MSNETPVEHYAQSRVTYRDIPESIVGNVLQIIEAIGLNEKQEESVKGLIREKIYYMFRNDVWIKPELTKAIREAYDTKNPDGQSVACEAVALQDIK